MKIYIIIVMLFFTAYNYAQIPSINETRKSDSKIGDLSVAIKNFDTVNHTIDKKDKKDFDKSNNTIDSKRKFSLYECSVFIDHFTKISKNYNFKIDSLQVELKEKQKISEMNEVIKLIDTNKAMALNSKIFLKKLVSTRNDYLGMFPSFNGNYRDEFFSEFFNEQGGHTNYLNNLSLAFGSATVHSELVSDYFGPMRITFGTVIDADSDENDTEEPDENAAKETESDLKRIINGGGNFYLNGMLPVHAYKSLSFSELTSINGNISTDIEGIGNNVKTTNVKGIVNISSYLSLSSDNKKFNFFVNADYGIIGGSDDFNDHFGLKSFLSKPAFVGKAIIGVTLLNLVRISITSKTISNYSSLISDKIMVGIQLLK